MHDCDVMLPRVRAHIEELQAEDAGAVRGKAGDHPDLDPRLAARAPHRTAYRGLTCSRSTCAHAVSCCLTASSRSGRGRRRPGTWLRLERAVDAHLRRAREARKAAKDAARAAAAAEAAEVAHREALEQASRAQAERDRAAAELGGTPATQDDGV